MQKIKKIKKKVLGRTKKKKNAPRKSKNLFKVFFQGIQSLVFENPIITLVSLFLFLAVFGVIIIQFSSKSSEQFFNSTLQTSLISSLRDQINSYNSQINKLTRCKNSWAPREQDVCRGVFYEKTNSACSGLNPPKIETYGSAICCNGYESDKMLPCLGADIFLNNIPKSDWTGVKLVATEDDCAGFGRCQFYPDPANYHAKVDQKNGGYLREDNGNIIIEKNCKVSRTISACNKDCGGGERTINDKLTNCTTAHTIELCNLTPCFNESVN